MSEDGSSGGAAQVGPSPEVVACIRAVVEELLERQRQDGSMPGRFSGAYARRRLRQRVSGASRHSDG